MTRRRAALILFAMAAVPAILSVFARSKASKTPANGFEFSEVERSGQKFKVAVVDLGAVSLDLYWKRQDGTPLESFGALRSDLADHAGRRLLFATNAGIFDTHHVPCGLHVQFGKQLVPINLNTGEGNFYMRPNGVFVVDERGARIVESGDYSGTSNRTRLATQSGPMLVIQGAINPQFNVNSNNRRVRSGVGVSRDGRVFLAISTAPVTFYDFATLFLTDLKCPDALYLDGVISRFYKESDPPPDGDSRFVGILGVTVAAS